MKLFTFVRCLALSLSLLCLLVSGSAIAQLRYEITWPVDGAVFQQNSVGKGEITVRGLFNSRSYIQGFYRIRLSLQPLDVKTGNPLPGSTTIVTDVPRPANAFAALFGMRIPNVDAGWYSLKAEMIPNSPFLNFLPRFTSAPIKVGIGEVFIIAGQSNAQGLPNNPGSYKVAQPFNVNTNAYDGVRVDKVANYSDSEKAANQLGNVSYYNWLFNYGIVSPMTGTNSLVGVQQAGIGPTGSSLWYWARLGEKIVNAKNVPVAFFNAAFYGTTITEWERSIDPNKKVLGLGNPGGVWGGATPYLGLPYNLLRKTVNLYTSLYGARAVLWMQGETDKQSQGDDRWDPVTVYNWNDDTKTETYNRRVSSSAEYAQKLQHVIAESRTLFQNVALPWVVAKASYERGSSSELVRQGQEIVITSTASVLRGPDMDQIYGNDKRRVQTDNVGDDLFGGEPTHLKGSGLNDAADAWYEALVGPGKLLNGAGPSPITVQDLGTAAQSLDLVDNGQTLVAPAGSTYRWLNEGSGVINPNDPISTQQRINAGYSLSGPSNAAPANTNANNNYRRALIQNGSGNFIITQAVPFPFTIVDDTPPPTDACSSFTEGAEVAYRAIGDPNIKVVVVQRGACKYAVWSDGSEDMPVDWLPYVNTIGTFTKDAMRQCLKFNSEPCGTTSPSCTFGPTVSSNVATPACGQGVQLTAGCNGADCGGVNYAWSGNGIGGSGSTVSVNVPNANGSFTYTLTASKAGCSNQSANITFTISGCGGGGSDPCSAFTPGTQVAYRAIGDPNIKVVVVQRGACKYAVWSDGSEDMPVDWLPYVNTIGTFTKDAMRQCLKFNGESCGARVGAVEPGSAVADLGLHIAPNPSNGRFTVHFQTRLGEVASLRLSDLSGRSVRAVQAITGTGGEHTEAIALPASVGGVVIVEVVSGGRRASQKVLIE